MYDWRKLTPKEREQVLTFRKKREFPWHSPPHFNFEGEHRFLISATCYDHQPVIGLTSDRMSECEQTILEIFKQFCADLYAWCILPNHYHSLVRTEQIEELRHALGQFHGRSSFKWNGEDQRRGRKVWHNCFDRRIKSQRHFWATLNYIHHNPVHHGYVDNWLDWPWSSARYFIEQVGREKAIEIWKNYPILDYGKKWDK